MSRLASPSVSTLGGRQEKWPCPLHCHPLSWEAWQDLSPLLVSLSSLFWKLRFPAPPPPPVPRDPEEKEASLIWKAEGGSARHLHLTHDETRTAGAGPASPLRPSIPHVTQAWGPAFPQAPLGKQGGLWQGPRGQPQPLSHTPHGRAWSCSPDGQMHGEGCGTYWLAGC